MATINDFGIPGVGTGILQPIVPNKPLFTFSCLSEEDNEFLMENMLWTAEGIAILHELRIRFYFSDKGRDPEKRHRFFQILKYLNSKKTDILMASHHFIRGDISDSRLYKNYAVLEHSAEWTKDKYENDRTKAQEYYETTLYCVRYEKLSLYGN